MVRGVGGGLADPRIRLSLEEEVGTKQQGPRQEVDNQDGSGLWWQENTPLACPNTVAAVQSYHETRRWAPWPAGCHSKAPTAVVARREREGGGEGGKHSVLLGTTNGLAQRQEAVRNQRPGKQMGNISNS